MSNWERLFKKLKVGYPHREQKIFSLLLLGVSLKSSCRFIDCFFFTQMRYTQQLIHFCVYIRPVFWNVFWERNADTHTYAVALLNSFVLLKIQLPLFNSFLYIWFLRLSSYSYFTFSYFNFLSNLIPFISLKIMLHIETFLLPTECKISYLLYMLLLLFFLKIGHPQGSTSFLDLHSVFEK